MIYLHPASACSPARIQAVQAATDLAAVINANGQMVLRPAMASSSCQDKAALSPVTPNTTPPNDAAPGVAGVFSTTEENHMKPETILKKIKPTLTDVQEYKVDQLIRAGHTFNSLFKDGSVELLSPQPENSPVYVERNGAAQKYTGSVQIEV